MNSEILHQNSGRLADSNKSRTAQLTRPAQNPPKCARQSMPGVATDSITFMVMLETI
jgi:hypothetical protein